MGLTILDAAYTPADHLLDNHYFIPFMDTSDEWIRSRTGIETRQFSTQPMVDFAAESARRLDLSWATGPIRLLLCATLSAEVAMPSTAAAIHERLALPEDVFSADINMACSGFVGALILAEGQLAPGECALVVGAEKLSAVTDVSDRSTGFLFGDGAGAVLVQKNRALRRVVYGTLPGEGLTLSRGGFVQMDGKHIYKFAVSAVPEMIGRLCPQGLDEVDYVVLHQANARILAQVAKKTGDGHKFLQNIQSWGNTSSASVPILLGEAAEQGVFQQGDHILLAGFGGGLTYAATLVTWRNTYIDE